MIYTNELSQLRKVLMNEYFLYRQGKISEKEYCIRAKTIDMTIDKLEMSTLLDIPVLKEAFLLYSQMREH